MAILRTTLVLLVAFGAPLVAQSDDPPSSHLNEEERAQLLDLLDESELFFLGSLAGVSDAQWNFKSAPDRWERLRRLRS